MGSDVTETGEVLTGILVPWSGISLGDVADADSVAERLVGQLTPSPTTALGSFSFEGEVSSSTDQMIVTVVRGGAWGSRGATIGIAHDSTLDLPQFRMDPHSLITTYEPVPATGSAAFSDMVVDSNGVVAWVGAYDDGSDWQYQAVIRDTAGDWGSPVTLTSVGNSAITNAAAAVCLAPGGGFLAFVVVGVDALPYIEVYHSPTGATWTRQETLRADSDGSTLGTGPDKIVACLHSGDVVIVYEYGTGACQQYVSSDGGASLDIIGSAASATYSGNLISYAGFLMWGYNDGDHKVARAGSGRDSLVSATAYTIDTASATSGPVLVGRPDGSLIAYYEDTGDLDSKISHDFGASWGEEMAVYEAAAAPVDGCAVALESQILYSDGRKCLHLGSWSNQAMPWATSTAIATRQRSWHFVWVPVNSLNAGGFTDSDTGTPTRTLSDSYVEVTSGIGETANNVQAETGGTTGAGTAVAIVVAQVTSGTASWYFEVGDGSTDNDIRVDLTSTGIRYYPTGGTAPSYTTHNVSGMIEVLLVTTPSEGSINTSLSYRARDGLGVRTWSTIETTANMGVGSYTGIRLTLQCPALSTVRWAMAGARSYVTQDVTSSGILEATLAAGAPLSPSMGTPIPGGPDIYALGGPVYRGETYTDSALYSRYRPQNVDPRTSPSPATVYRSAGTAGSPLAADISLVWTLASGSADCDIGSDILGIHLVGVEGLRQPTVTITRNGGGNTITDTTAWSTTIQYSTDTGDGIWPAEAGSDVGRQWVEADELVGDLFEYSTGEITRITGNTAGYLTYGATVAEHRAVFYVETPTGAAETNQTGYIWHRDVLILVHLRGRRDIQSVTIDADYATSAAGPGPGGYLQIGTANVGPVYVLGMAPDLDDRNVAAHLVEVTDGAGGIMHVRQVAGERREIELAYAQSPHDETQILNATTGDYVTGSTNGAALPVASRFGAPHVLRGIQRQTRQGAVPVSWIPRIPRDTGTRVSVHVAHRAEGAVYGRMLGTSEVRYLQYVGQRGRTRLLRGAAVRIVEER